MRILSDRTWSITWASGREVNLTGGAMANLDKLVAEVEEARNELEGLLPPLLIPAVVVSLH